MGFRRNIRLVLGRRVDPVLVFAKRAFGARGLVIAGVGKGNLKAASLGAVKRAIGQDVVVVRSTRVPGGVVGRNVEVDDDAIGTVASGTLNPAKSRVLPKLALLETSALSNSRLLRSLLRLV